MIVLHTRNVHDVLPRALKVLEQHGVKRDSRNGPVIVAPWPVSTVYSYPCERVIFWPQRDANPFFHLYESLWMISGRRDVEPLKRYAKNVANYSDDGRVYHGAYGWRWRNEWMDQLAVIAARLKEDPTDRRCVLQMWHSDLDLGINSKDLPCNTTATFQRGVSGELNLVVFCRSNDIVWGSYGANIVQFSTLLEYMALWIGCPVGTYTQVSVNFHAYQNIFETLKDVRPDRVNFVTNPYIDRQVYHVPMRGSIKEVNDLISVILEDADLGYKNGVFYPKDPWANVVYRVLYAHHTYKTSAEKRHERALEILNGGDPKSDWIVAAKEWIMRRQIRHANQNEK